MLAGQRPGPLLAARLALIVLAAMVATTISPAVADVASGASKLPPSYYPAPAARG
jgi:hypothetical protein